MFVLIHSKPLQMFQLALFFPYRNRCRHTLFKKKQKKPHHLPILDRQRMILSLSHALHNATKSMKTPLRTPRDGAHAAAASACKTPGFQHLLPRHRGGKAKAFTPGCIILNPQGVWPVVFLPHPLEGRDPWRWIPFREALSLEKGGKHLQGPSLRKTTSKILEISAGFKARRPFRRTSCKNKQLNLPRSPLCWGQLFVRRRISRKLCSTFSLDLRSQHMRSSQCSLTNDELCQAHINT